MTPLLLKILILLGPLRTTLPFHTSLIILSSIISQTFKEATLPTRQRCTRTFLSHLRGRLARTNGNLAMASPEISGLLSLALRTATPLPCSLDLAAEIFNSTPMGPSSPTLTLFSATLMEDTRPPHTSHYLSLACSTQLS